MSNFKEIYDKADYYKYHTNEDEPLEKYISESEIRLSKKQTAKTLLAIKEYYSSKNDEIAVNLLNVLIGNTKYHKKIVFTYDGSYRNYRVFFDYIAEGLFKYVDEVFPYMCRSKNISLYDRNKHTTYKLYKDYKGFIKALKFILNNYDKVFIQIPIQCFWNLKNGNDLFFNI